MLVTRNFSKKPKPFYTYIDSKIIARLPADFNEKISRRLRRVNIFEEVKSSVSARAVIENYGLKVGRNGMACCPFHNDKHPSMKVDDTHYHCFGCGAHGDAIGYVAQMYSISQYEAACKIVDDFHLLIDTNHEFSEDEKKSFEKVQEQKAFVAKVQKKFKNWINETIDELKECENLIEEARETFIGKEPGAVFISNGFAYMLRYESVVGYWLDVLCMGSEEDKRQLFLVDGKEVKRIAANIKRAGNEILGRTRQCAG